MIAIRADANNKIGAGHMMRCLAIANEIRRQHQEVVIITADECPVKLIKQWGFRHVVLKTEYTHMEHELNRLMAFIEVFKIDCIIVDSYYVSQQYFQQLTTVVTTVYIEDVAEIILPCDMIINYNISFSEFEYERLYHTVDTKLLLGTSFVPLREEFSDIKHLPIREQIQDILITTGGTDPFNLSTHLAKRIFKDISLQDVRVHIVVGAFNHHKEKLDKLAKKFSKLVIHENVASMSNLMLSCDIAVSASGSTLYEICACGVPCTIFSFADNQTQIRACFEKSGAMIDCGDLRSNKNQCIKNLIGAIRSLQNDDKRAHLREITIKITDGKGASRLAQNIISLVNLKRRLEEGDKCD